MVGGALGGPMVGPCAFLHLFYVSCSNLLVFSANFKIFDSLRFFNSSFCKKNFPKKLCLSPMKKGHLQKMCITVSSSSSHLGQSEEFPIFILKRCFLTVACPVMICVVSLILLID